MEILVIDDGSTDGTARVAQETGVDHVIRNRRNKGLAHSFRIGLNASLQQGADIIVNTDGDNQYVGQDIPKLIEPILRGEADIVIGVREIGQIDHFSWLKKLQQRLGSAVVRQISDVHVSDAVSGFRAMSRDAALQINIVSPFSYTTEMLIQAGKKKLEVTEIPIATNFKARESRLFNNLPRYIERQVTTMLRIYAMYQPFRMFFYIGTILALIGLIPMVRFLVLSVLGDGAGHIQSVILGGVFLVMGFVTYLVGLVADLINFNRNLIETTLEKVRRLELTLLEEKSRDRPLSPNRERGNR